MTRHRIAQIGENRNPKSPENRPQTRRFLQIRLLQLRRSATPFNGLAVLHGRLHTIKDLTRKMPDQPLALGFDVKNLAVDFSRPSDMTLRRGFA